MFQTIDDKWSTYLEREMKYESVYILYLKQQMSVQCSQFFSETKPPIFIYYVRNFACSFGLI